MRKHLSFPIFFSLLYIFVLVMSSETVQSACFIAALIDDACIYVVLAQPSNLCPRLRSSLSF